MKRKKGKAEKFMSFEKKFKIIGGIVILALWLCSISTKATLSSLNVEVERLNNEVKAQEKANQSLVMKINELASLENIQSVANSEGLAYNNGNIIVVNDN